MISLGKAPKTLLTTHRCEHTLFSSIDPWIQAHGRQNLGTKSQTCTWTLKLTPGSLCALNDFFTVTLAR